MVLDGLCWECKERLEAKGHPILNIWGVDPWLHCHHEPKEKVETSSIESKYRELRLAVWEFVTLSSSFEIVNRYQARLKTLLGDYVPKYDKED